MIITTGQRVGVSNFTTFYNNELLSPSNTAGTDFVSYLESLTASRTTTIFLSELYQQDSSFYGCLLVSGANAIIINSTGNFVFSLNNADTAALFTVTDSTGLTQFFSGAKLLNSSLTADHTLQVYNDVQFGSDYFFIYLLDAINTKVAYSELKGLFLNSNNNLSSYNVMLTSGSNTDLTFTSATNQRVRLNVRTGINTYAQYDYTTIGQVFTAPNTSYTIDSLTYYVSQGLIYF